ncbi:MAG: MFS transporter [Simkaniaceae bacterium]|nr:MFS transporter [Simkaniaceae bacterium]
MKKPRLFNLLFLVSFASVSAVTIAPALPALMKFLGESESAIQLFMTLFLVGYVVGQLPYGPLGARFGLKKVVLVTSLGAVATSVWTYFAVASHSYGGALASRFLLALFTSSGLKVAFAYIGKCYEDHEMSKFSSYVTVAFAVGPSLGVVMTGYVTNLFGWHGALLFQIAYAIAAFFVFLGLPHDEGNRQEVMALKQVVGNFRSHFANAKVFLPGILMGIVPAFAYCFATEAPFLGISVLKMSPGMYGVFNLFASMGMMTGGMLGVYFNTRFSCYVLIRLALIFLTLISVTFFVIMVLGYLTPWTLFIPIFFICICLPFIQSNAAGYAMAQGKNKSYTSSSINFLGMLLAFCVVSSLAAIPSQAIYLLAAFFCGLCILGWIFFTIFKKKTVK